jgi:4-amino-4-deoxy-L-arabinose transferase-like glycosyltransferase
MNIFTPLLIAAYGLPPMAVIWIARHVFGREITWAAAWVILFVATLVVVDIGLALDPPSS